MTVDHGVSAGCCAGSGALPKHFLQPCLLLLLKEQPGYGYDLVARLKKLGVDDDSATVYRALRTLEERHAVASHWNTSSTGPARHVYQLTPAGEDQLLAAFEAAVDMHLAIQRYFSRYAAAEGTLSGDLQGDPGPLGQDALGRRR
jgi:poly-beta-hydroxybutyrate-responsive repressor